MFIICSLIRIRASWEKFVFSLYTNFFCPQGTLLLFQQNQSWVFAWFLVGLVWCGHLSCLTVPRRQWLQLLPLYPCSWIGPCPRNHGVWQAYINLLVLRTLRHLPSLLIPYVPLGSRNTTFLGFPYSAGYSSPSSSGLRPWTTRVHRGSSRASGRFQFSALLIYEASWKLRPCGPCKSLTWKSESRTFQWTANISQF